MASLRIIRFNTVLDESGSISVECRVNQLPWVSASGFRQAWQLVLYTQFLSLKHVWRGRFIGQLRRQFHPCPWGPRGVRLGVLFLTLNHKNLVTRHFSCGRSPADQPLPHVRVQLRPFPWPIVCWTYISVPCLQHSEELIYFSRVLERRT